MPLNERELSFSQEFAPALDKSDIIEDDINCLTFAAPKVVYDHLGENALFFGHVFLPLFVEFFFRQWALFLFLPAGHSLGWRYLFFFAF